MAQLKKEMVNINHIADNGNEQPTMSSREIAELVEKRHDNVKRTIETLVERGVIGLPQIEEYLDSLGRSAKEYKIGKRDSYIIVAQLSPEFTARLVDRWQELEEQKKVLSINDLLSSPVHLLELAQGYAQQVVDLRGEVKEMQEDVNALDRIGKADGSLCITEAAKALQMRPKDLFSWLRSNGWIYKRTGSAHYLGYQSKTQIGVLEHKVTTVNRADGTEKMTEQVRITAKGITRLAKLIKPALQLA